MITGFNTDVDFEGRVFHVQTEDRGQGNPVVETLIYCGGEIIAQRSTSYDDLTQAAEVEDEILQRMENQHQAMIRQILNGKFESSGPKPFGHNIISSRSLDEVVLGFLAENYSPEKIRLEVVDEMVPVEGTACNLRLRVSEDATQKPIVGARVVVTLLSTMGDPRRMFAARSNGEGLVETQLEIPELPGADSAVICEARFAGGKAEVRQLVAKQKMAKAGAAKV